MYSLFKEKPMKSRAVLPTLTDGQIFIGKTEDNPQAGWLQSGPGVEIVTGPGSIQITSTAISPTFPWSLVQSPLIELASNQGYIIIEENAVLTLPRQNNIGKEIIIVAKAAQWKISGKEGQKIILREEIFDLGAQNAVSNIRGNSLHLICSDPSGEFIALSVGGSFSSEEKEKHNL